MIEPKPIETNLPQVDCKDDPSGAAVAWALLAMGTALIVSTILAAIWAVNL
jgi:hypothetical protein